MDFTNKKTFDELYDKHQSSRTNERLKKLAEYAAKNQLDPNPIESQQYPDLKPVFDDYERSKDNVAREILLKREVVPGELQSRPFNADDLILSDKTGGVPGYNLREIERYKEMKPSLYGWGETSPEDEKLNYQEALEIIKRYLGK